MYSFFLFLIPVVFATHPKPYRCCTSELFEADIMEVGGYVDPTTGNATLIDFSAHLYYNYRMKMLRADRMIMGKMTTSITDYNKMMEYTIVDGACTAKTTMSNMTEPCIPDEAQFVGTNFLGSIRDRQHVDIHTWRVTQSTGVTVKISVTEDDCSPVAQTIYGTVLGVPTSVTYFFSNFARGLSRLDTFNMPAACHGVMPSLTGKRSDNVELPLMAFNL